jgi:hypothetical protein
VISNASTEALLTIASSACDLCFTKKIKCDMLKPVCSNCKLYKSQCRTSSIRRKANPPRPKPAVDAMPYASNATAIDPAQPPAPAATTIAADKDALEDRLARIERHLQQVLEVAAALSERQDHLLLRDTSPRAAAPAGPGRTGPTPPSSSSAGSSSGSSGSSDHMPAGYTGTGTGTGTASPDTAPFVFGAADPVAPNELYSLPPLQELLPTVDHYFNTFNRVVPLFHQPTFMRMLNSWFDAPATRHKAAWAAILIVAAIGMRTPREAGDGDGLEPGPGSTSDRAVYANHCLRNAQSVVSELVNREEDLLGIQVLLGIVVLFRNSNDPRPASVIVATAMRLAHRLQLHSGSSRRFFSPDDVEQRARVFWIAYSLDKTISLHTVTPSIQLDADIDLPLPPLAPLDGAGLIWSLDGRAQLNYHRQRAELAHLEGKVFDLLYSNRASRVGVDERRRVSKRLGGMLEGWYQRLPEAFHIENVVSTLGGWELIEMTKLLHAYLYTFFMAHGLYSHNSYWVKQLSSSGRAVIKDLGLIKGPDGALGPEEEEDASHTWDRFVELSRGCMKLFQYTMPTECLIWQCSCAHFSSLIVLLANTYMNPTHPSVAEDQSITTKSVQYFDRSIDMFNPDGCKSVRCVIHELLQKSNAAVDQARVSFSSDDSMDSDASAADFGAFAVNMDMFPAGGKDFFEPSIWEPLSAPDPMSDLFGIDPVHVMAPIAADVR